MNKQINLDKLNEHLFESIEMLKNSSDPKASACEKIDVQTAKEIANLGKTIIDGYKVKLQAAELLRDADNPNSTSNFLKEAGFVTENIIPIEINKL